MEASRWNRDVIIQVLIDGGADINLADEFGVTSLMFVVQHASVCPGILEMELNLLISLSFLPRFACFQNAIEAVQVLVENGANRNFKSNRGQNPPNKIKVTCMRSNNKYT